MPQVIFNVELVSIVLGVGVMALLEHTSTLLDTAWARFFGGGRPAGSGGRPEPLGLGLGEKAGGRKEQVRLYFSPQL